MDSQQPEAKSQSHGGDSPVVAVRRVQPRKYPKPPGLARRLVLLCLKPEAWPAAAQYPFWVTLIPLILAILIAGMAIGVSDAYRFVDRFGAFARSYDAHYPAMEINGDGVLSTKKTAALPIVIGDNLRTLYVDPSGKTTLESIKEETAMLVTDHQVFMKVLGREGQPEEIKTFVPSLMPAKGTTKTIDGTSLQAFIQEQHAALVGGAAFMSFVGTVIGESVWAAVIMFLICPLVMLAAGFGETPLMLPKRAAYRIAAAVLVPLILLSALLQAIGHPVSALLGPDRGQVFWFFAAAAMAVWSGVMAKKLFASKPAKRRAT